MGKMRFANRPENSAQWRFGAGPSTKPNTNDGNTADEGGPDSLWKNLLSIAVMMIAASCLNQDGFTSSDPFEALLQALWDLTPLGAALEWLFYAWLCVFAMFALIWCFIQGTCHLVSRI